MKFGRGDDLGKLLHVSWLDVDDVEALVLDIQIPEVDSKIVTADKGLAIAVHGDAIYMVGVGIGVCSPRDGGHNGIVMCQPRELQRRRILKCSPGRASDASTSDGIDGRQLIG